MKTKHEFWVGKRVRVVGDEVKLDKANNIVHAAKEMFEYCGKVVTISQICENGDRTLNYLRIEECQGYNWQEESFIIEPELNNDIEGVEQEIRKEIGL